MNKIFSKRDLSLICNDYVNFIEPFVRARLNFVIGIVLLYEGKKNIDLNSDIFSYNGDNFSIDLKVEDKKKILNIFFTKHKKKERVYINSGKLILPLNFRLKSIYKSSISSDTLNSVRFIDLSIKLSGLLKDKIDITLGSYLYNQKSYCQNLSDIEKNIISEVFPYNQIFQKKENKWFYATSLAHELNTPVCPYCNREFISSVRTNKNEKVIGPTFDHFLSQKDYPFLKLSFYNLVPSCTTCNSRLKNQIEFDFDYFMYPFDDSYEGQATFKLGIDYKEIDTKINESDLIDESRLSIQIQPKNKYIQKLHGTIPLNQKKGNLNVFKTEKIYNDSHKDVAFDILERFQKVPKSHIESTFKILKDQGKSHPEIYRFYFGNYLEEEDFNKRPLARMTRDIVKQLENVYKVGINTK